MKRYAVLVRRLTSDYVVGPFETEGDAIAYIQHYNLVKSEIIAHYEPVPIEGAVK